MTRRRVIPFAVTTLVTATLLLFGCSRQDAPRLASLTADEVRPEKYLPADLAARPDSAVLARSDSLMDTDEEAQPATLGPLPFGMSFDMIRTGDALFHDKAGCYNCHGSEGQGLAARGKTLTAGLHFIGAGDWAGVDSIIAVGIPDSRTRSPIAMPPRGQHGDLTAAEMRAVAAYVWAISSVRGEPWTGGHRSHEHHDPRASARTSIP